ncbi:MAG: response regulator [Candidatus Omnitrophota bacterium]
MPDKKILIIDDEADIQKLVTLRLRKAGYEVFSISSGAQAMSAIKAFAPDLILLDLRLPHTDGIHICHQVKTDPQHKHIPVIIFTAVNPQSVTERLKDCQADDFILKPFRSEDLLARISRCLKRGSF